MVLEKRQEQILLKVVEDYILTAEPVSSKHLVEKYRFKVSPATIRNELVVLEEMDYLIQPHTSAGRVPTDKGYRYYVNTLVERQGLSPAEQKSIHQFYSHLNKELEDLMRETSSVLSKLTSCVAIVFTPLFDKSNFRHLDLVALGPRIVLVVLITTTGCVQKQVVEFKRSVDADDIQKLEKILNEEFANLDLSKISEKLAAGLKNIPASERDIAKKVVAEIVDFLSHQERERIFTKGQANILGYPEFADVDKVYHLLQTLEQDYVLLHLLKGALGKDKPVVKIGSENKEIEMKDLSFIAASYKASETIGTLGILGPRRMNYLHSISTVSFIAQSLSKVLESLLPES